MKLGSKTLREYIPTDEEKEGIRRMPIFFVLDEVLDTYNIGSFFRLADAVSAQKVYLTGNMAYPPSSRVHKAAVGTEQWTPWEKRDTALEVIKELKEAGVQILCVEQSTKSIPWKDLTPTFPVAIVLGNETHGVRKEVLEIADVIVELPMLGVNKSFNVWGSGAIVAYKLLEFLNIT